MYRSSILLAPPLLLLLLVLVGVASAKSISGHGNDAALQPMVTATQARRICATLCMSGLGGKPCGDDCLGVVPDGMRLQSANRTASGDVSAGRRARTDVCPVLCANDLGYPLCTCEEKTVVATPTTDVDYVQVCGYTCLNLKYHIAGCQSCHVYHDAAEKYGAEAFAVGGKTPKAKAVDWEEWCKEMCLIGEGGIACNCDILPMSINLTP